MAGRGATEYLYFLLLSSVIGCYASSGSLSSGVKFITVFLQNYDTSAALSLHIISYQRPATVSVSVSMPEFSRSVFVNANSTAVLTLDSSFMLSGNEISKKAIRVVSNENISLIILNGRSKTYDSFLSLPFHILGTKYYVVTYTVDSPYNIKQFAIANGNERVVVTLRVAGSLIFNGTQYFDKEEFSFRMEPNQAIQFQSNQDLTGTKVKSTGPVAVFSGDQCITVPPSNCDHIAEQLYPVDMWSDRFIVFPLMMKVKEDLITIVSAYNGTAVSIRTSKGSWSRLLGEGSHMNFNVSGGTYVNSTQPIMVTYLSTGGSMPMVSSFDPFLVNVIPRAYFSSHYVFVTIENMHNYILLVSPGTSPSGIILDGRPLSDYRSENSTFSHYTATRIYLGETGSRHVVHHPSTHFAIYIYGIGRAESYGYPMDEGDWGALTCLTQAAIFTLPTWALTRAALSTSDVHLVDPTCHAEPKDEDWVFIRAPFDGCGTTIVNETGKIVYVNTIYGTAPRTPIHRLKIKLMCEMSTTENITLGFVPHSNYVLHQGHYNISFTLHNSPSFDSPVFDFPYKTALNRTLYLEMEADTNDSGVQIFTENCISVPALSQNHLRYTIIENGCPKDSTFKYFLSHDPRKERFSFHVFKFEGHSQVFIVCEVVICHRTSSPNRCTQGCLPSRSRRGLNTWVPRGEPSRLAQGPLVFPSNLEGLRLTMNSEKGVRNYYVPAVALLSVGCVMSVLAVILQRKYYLHLSQGHSAPK
ncbi:IgGFc-binding protein-like isoform X2 [Narcine bancroftii]|uniref:IgGFc-binding protein-like isoform X2 n=1 Tax=Narcine bancroftii TaxID=1343680 RepID=UPI00383177CD